MTPDMISRARANARKLGFDNVEFRLGEIEHLPVESGRIDAIISNCVLNLLPDKAPAFIEMFRVLRPGGRFCVSDIVATGRLPEGVREAAELHVGCVAGALPEKEISGFDRRSRLRGRAERQGATDQFARRDAVAAYERE
jgi:arsenite methyltransferase